MKQEKKITHFPPVFKNAVEIFFIDFACVVIKADKRGKKHNKFNLIHHVPPLPWHMSITQSCQMGPSAVQYKIHVSGSKIDLRQLMHPFKLLIYLQVPKTKTPLFCQKVLFIERKNIYKSSR